MAGHLRKRSFSIAGHRTSVALEPEFWRVLEQAASRSGRSLPQLVAQADAVRDPAIGLASVLRLLALAEPNRTPSPQTDGHKE